jgi:hypothetical protein
MVGPLLPILGATVGALWLAVCLAHPHRPRRPDEIAALAYARLVAQRDRLTLLAIFATTVLAILLLIAALAPTSNYSGS